MLAGMEPWDRTHPCVPAQSRFWLKSKVSIAGSGTIEPCFPGVTYLPETRSLLGRFVHTFSVLSELMSIERVVLSIDATTKMKSLCGRRG